MLSKAYECHLICVTILTAVKCKRKYVTYMLDLYLCVGCLLADFDLFMLKCLNQFFTLILSDGSNVIMSIKIPLHPVIKSDILQGSCIYRGSLAAYASLAERVKSQCWLFAASLHCVVYPKQVISLYC